MPQVLGVIYATSQGDVLTLIRERSLIMIPVFLTNAFHPEGSIIH